MSETRETGSACSNFVECRQITQTFAYKDGGISSSVLFKQEESEFALREIDRRKCTARHHPKMDGFLSSRDNYRDYPERREMAP